MSDRPLPVDCDHPEESLGPLPYRVGRRSRADEWECGVCGMWNVVDEPVYTRRPVEEYVEASQRNGPYRHVRECAHYQGLSPAHIGSPAQHPSYMGCSCQCHHTSYFDSTMWTWPTTPTSDVQRVNQLVAEGKLSSMSVDVDMDQREALNFKAVQLAGVRVVAVGVVPQFAVDVMTTMYDLVSGRWATMRWEMSKEMLSELHKSAIPPSGLYSQTFGRMTIFGGEIVVSYNVYSDITLRAR